MNQIGGAVISKLSEINEDPSPKDRQRFMFIERDENGKRFECNPKAGIYSDFLY